MSKHEVETVLPVGSDGVFLIVAFDYSPPTRAVYSGPMTGPAEDARLEYLTCWLKSRDTMPLVIQTEADKWAEEWLADEGRDRAIRAVGGFD